MNLVFYNLARFPLLLGTIKIIKDEPNTSPIQSPPSSSSGAQYAQNSSQVIRIFVIWGSFVYLTAIKCSLSHDGILVFLILLKCGKVTSCS